MRLYAGGYLTFYMPEQQPEIEWALSEPVALYELLKVLGIPVAEVQLVIINGEIADIQQAQINNQDVVKAFPGVDGG
jgi:sulfur carrier protein ThiS